MPLLWAKGDERASESLQCEHGQYALFERRMNIAVHSGRAHTAPSAQKPSSQVSSQAISFNDKSKR